MEDRILHKDSNASAQCGLLMKLLATEWTLLKTEPLSLSIFREIIVRLAVMTIKDGGRNPQERMCAIAVLRTISKANFAENLSDLFSATKKDTLLTCQLLYCAYTYLRRDYLLTESIEPLAKALDKCLSSLPQLDAQSKDDDLKDIRRTIEAMLKQYKSRTNSMPIAWKELQEIFKDYRKHNSLCEPIKQLRFGYDDHFKDSSTRPPNTDWRLASQNWEERCVSFLYTTLVPLLKPLRSVFEGADIEVIIGKRESEALAQFSERGDAQNNITKLSQLLEKFSKDENSIHTGDWEVFIEARDFLWALVFDPGRFEDNIRKDGSALIKILWGLQGCPTSVQSLLDDIPKEDVEGLEIIIKNDLKEKDYRVFCHKTVASECLAELMHNVRHVKPASPGDLVKVEVRAFREDETGKGEIHIVVSNDGLCVKPEERGEGLKAAMERLKPYGAYLEILKTDQLGSWTFSVDLSFQEGR